MKFEENSKGKLAAVDSGAVDCTKFSAGLVKEFREPPEFFAFPLNQKEPPNS